MATHRDTALRRAEALIEQGQLDAAMEESARLVDAHPTDWPLLNALGDAFARAGASDRAVPLYLRIADAYLAEGFYARAAGFYKKALKYVPTHEGTLLKLAKACAFQGLRADARGHLQAVLTARRRRGDREGVAVVLASLDDLHAQDFAARLDAVRALVPIQPSRAVERLRRIAEDLETNAREEEALAVWNEVLAIDPADRAACLRLARAAMSRGDLAEALSRLGSADTLDRPEEFELLAEVQRRAGDLPGASVTERHWLRDADGAPASASGPSDAEPMPDAEPTAAQSALAAEPARDAEPVIDLEPVIDMAPLIDVAPVVDVQPVVDAEPRITVEPTLSPDSVVAASPTAARQPVETQPILEPLAEAPAPAKPARVTYEVDLTDRVNALAAVTHDGDQADTLESALTGVREQVTADSADWIAIGRTYLHAGLPDQAVDAFVRAAHDPARRYEAALALVDVFDARQDAAAVVDWLERAAEAAPTAARRGAILYRLGQVLEQVGEPERALAVLLELQELAPSFRDVAARVARLTAALPGGASSTP